MTNGSAQVQSFQSGSYLQMHINIYIRKSKQETEGMLSALVNSGFLKMACVLTTVPFLAGAGPGQNQPTFLCLPFIQGNGCEGWESVQDVLMLSPRWLDSLCQTRWPHPLRICKLFIKLCWHSAFLQETDAAMMSITGDSQVNPNPKENEESCFWQNYNLPEWRYNHQWQRLKNTVEKEISGRLYWAVSPESDWKGDWWDLITFTVGTDEWESVTLYL